MAGVQLVRPDYTHINGYRRTPTEYRYCKAEARLRFKLIRGGANSGFTC